MMKVGRATSSMMKVRGATKSNSRNYEVMFIYIVIDKRTPVSVRASVAGSYVHLSHTCHPQEFKNLDNLTKFPGFYRPPL